MNLYSEEVITPVPGSFWDRLIVYNDNGQIGEHRDRVEYISHSFENGVKIYHFRTIAVPGSTVPESHIPVPESQFPVTSTVFEGGEPDMLNSFITYSPCRTSQAEGSPTAGLSSGWTEKLDN